MKVGDKEYVMTFDYHTHTVYSHGKGTIEDNVKSAIVQKLNGIAITDHGPGHLTYGMKRSAIPSMRNEIMSMRQKYPEIDIFMGVEANIVENGGNCLDVSMEEQKEFDFILAGYHYGVMHGYCVSNYLLEHTPVNILERSQKRKNTEMTVEALHRNPNIIILTHPGDKGPLDMDEVARACAETGTFMEISTWHPHLTVAEIEVAAKYDVEFVISSDAHVARRVGTFEAGVQRAVDAKLDLSRIVNITEREEQR